MKKMLKKIGLVTACILLVTSCVSSRKYASAIKERENYKKQETDSEAKIADLQKSKDNLESQLTASDHQLKQKQQELNKNNMELSMDQNTLNKLQKAVKIEQQEVSGIRQEVCDALKCFTPDELSVKERDGELYVSMYDKLLFPTGSAVVNDRGKKALQMLSDVLIKNNMKIMVEGHTDNVPIHNSKYNDNWDLSVNRATNVTRLLINDKVAPNRIIASGKGKYQPFDTNNTEMGRKFNRRTDIVLVPKLNDLYSLINQGNNLNLNPLSNNSTMNKLNPVINKVH